MTLDSASSVVDIAGLTLFTFLYIYALDLFRSNTTMADRQQFAHQFEHFDVGNFAQLSHNFLRPTARIESTAHYICTILAYCDNPTKNAITLKMTI